MKTKQIIALALCAVLSLLTPCTAFANSAPKYWSGADSYGAIIADAECPVVVESELLTFDIPDFPKKNYSNKEDYLAYKASVTARYNFYNPADYTVTAKLEFPFGTAPEYSNGDDVSKYDITINDSAIPKTVRHTLMRKGGGFKLAEDMPRITDGYKKDSFFAPNLPVTKYVYEIADYDENYKDACVAFDFRVLFDRKVLFKEMDGIVSRVDSCRLSRSARRSDNTLTLYVFGRKFDAPPKWKFYKDRNCNNGEEISGSVNLLSADEMTFMEFAMSEYPENSYILESDWYNAMVDELNFSGIERYNCIIRYSRIFNLKSCLLRWYEYEITLAPGERIVNSVTAPIYPDIDEDWKPPVYKYTYLLSPAQTWTDFGSLDIVINTPFYLIDNKDFQKTETGYRLSLDGLPDGELEFSLSSSKKPARDNSWFAMVFALFCYFAISLLELVVLVLLIGGVVVLICRKKRKNVN
ncbi:MAG: hypothetical protein HDT42_04505 [Ruminococcaceae bacterium]|nr:hypothetical protein [Oscillospiraceae bacterium]